MDTLWMLIIVSLAAMVVLAITMGIAAFAVAVWLLVGYAWDAWKGRARL